MQGKRPQDQIYMNMTIELSKLSKCNRKKVGCLIVKDTQIISEGVNGGLIGGSNCCEDSDGNTKETTIHAEKNALLKVSRKGGVGCNGSDMYVTMAPCIHCAPEIAQSGIKRLIYGEVYRDSSGIDYLKKHTNIEVVFLSSTSYE